MNRSLHESLILKQLDNTERINPSAGFIKRMQNTAMAQLDRIFSLRQIWTFSLAFILLVFANAILIGYHINTSNHPGHKVQQPRAEAQIYNPVNGLYNE